MRDLLSEEMQFIFTAPDITVDHDISFLGASSNLRKATISFAMSVCPSLRREQLGSHWTDFHKILHLKTFRKSAEKIQVPLKSVNNNGYFT